MYRLLTNTVALVTLFTTASIAMHSTALESDSSQPVTWNADGNTTIRNEGDFRIIEMSTNVEISQGSLKITGDEAVFQYRAVSGELVKVTVLGAPVRYSQQLAEDGDEVSGDSQTLEMYNDALTGETIIELIGEAHFNSPDSSLSCAAIVYVADSDFIREAPGPCTGSFTPAAN